MKTVIFAVLILLAFSYGEGLRCNHCIGRRCTNYIVTCSNDYDVCARVFFLPPASPTFFKRCIKESDCRLMESMPNTSVYCCKTDLCN